MAAGQHQRDAVGRFFQRDRQQQRQDRHRGLLDVVEDQQRRTRQRREGARETTPARTKPRWCEVIGREAAAARAGAQRGDARRRASRRSGRCRCRRRRAGTRERQRARLQVARGEHRLAGAGLAASQMPAAVEVGVEPVEKALARQRLPAGEASAWPAARRVGLSSWCVREGACVRDDFARPMLGRVRCFGQRAGRGRPQRHFRRPGPAMSVANPYRARPGRLVQCGRAIAAARPSDARAPTHRHRLHLRRQARADRRRLHLRQQGRPGPALHRGAATSR